MQDLFYQSIPNSHTLLHHLSIDGVAVDGVVGEAGEELGEGGEGGNGLGDGIQGWGRGSVETAFCEDGHGNQHLVDGSHVFVEGCQLMARLNKEVVGNDHAVMQLIVNGTIRGDSQYFHRYGVVTI